MLVSTSVNHPRVVRTDPESVRVFLRQYDQYSKEVIARASQISASGTVPTEAVRPVNITFCVDPEYLESAIALDLISDVESESELTDTVLRSYLERKAEESKESVNLDALDMIVERDLHMDMTDRNAKSRMESLFVSYHALLRRNGISWLLKTNQKVAVSHVLSAVRPKSLQDRLQSDLDFAYYDYRKDFRQFMEHAVRLSDAFQLLDNGPKTTKKTDNRHGKPTRSGGNSNRGKGSASDFGNGKKSLKNNRPAPDCPFGTCKKKSAKHLIKECPEATDAEKSKMLSERIAARALDGPSRATRSQTTARSDTRTAPNGNIGRLKPSNTENLKTDDSPSYNISLSDGMAELTALSRCDDSSDDSIVAAKMAERASSQGIGKITKIKPVRLQVALKSGDDAQEFTFSRTWI